MNAFACQYFLGQAQRYDMADAKAEKDCPRAFGKYALNYKPDSRDPREKLFRATPYFARNVKLPSRVDLRENLPEPLEIYDQGSFGACVSHSVANSLRFVVTNQAKDTDPDNDVPLTFRPSRFFVYWNARKKAKLPPDEDTGVGIRDAFAAVSDYSACSEDLWPYVGENIFKEPPPEAYKDAEKHPYFVSLRLSQDAYAVKLCLHQGYPISIGLQIYDSFLSEEVAKTGNVPMPDVEKENAAGGHALTIVGYETNSEDTAADDVFLVLNSWGPEWGDHGVCRIPVQYILHPALCDDFHSLREFY